MSARTTVSPVTGRRPRTLLDEFRDFVEQVEPRLWAALTAAYGREEGRDACAAALAWAWEHWDRLATMENPAGYLYRVGQSERRRITRPLRMPPFSRATQTIHDDVLDPTIANALSRLPTGQRVAVALVHMFGWSQHDVAGLLNVSPSTVKQALDRGARRLRQDLEGHDG